MLPKYVMSLEDKLCAVLNSVCCFGACSVGLEYIYQCESDCISVSDKSVIS